MYLPHPDSFTLTSDADSPDPDGSFNLSWGVSFEANNYSVYQSNESIIEPNSTMEIISGNTNRTYSFTNLTEGDYYFLVVAFNVHGNTSSNCLKITVKSPPGGCILTHNATNPDYDGNFTLNWTISERATNYSIYRSNNFIYDIDNNGTLIIEGLTNQSYLISNELDCSFYYVIVAYNEAGKNVSNCVQIVVGRVPLSFNFSIEAGNPDMDGRFYLIWSPSNFTDNYTIYFYGSYITEINSSLSILEKELEQSDNPQFIPEQYILEYHGWNNGAYYFIIIANNTNGNYTSICIKLIISIPPSPNNDSDEPTDDIIIFYIGGLILFGIMIIGLSLTSVLRKRKRMGYYKHLNKTKNKQKIEPHLEKKKSRRKDNPQARNKRLKHNPKRN